MLIGFEFASWYAVAALVAAGYVFWSAVFAEGHKQARWLWRRVHPLPPDPPPPPPRAPVIVFGAVDYLPSTFAVPERRLKPRRYLSELRVRYLIENKEATVTVTNVETGARRRDDGRVERFEAFRAPGLAPLETAPAESFRLSREIIDGLADNDFEQAFVFWARYTTPDGTRWETTYDPAANDHASRTVSDHDPPPHVQTRQPLLVPLSEDTWHVGARENVGGEHMQLHVLPVLAGILNAGEAVALVDDVTASGQSLGTATCIPPPSIPAGDRVTLRLEFAWLPAIHSGDRVEVAVAYHGPDGRPHTPLVFSAQYFHPGRWRIDRRSLGG